MTTPSTFWFSIGCRHSSTVVCYSTVDGITGGVNQAIPNQSRINRKLEMVLRVKMHQFIIVGGFFFDIKI